MTFVRPGAVVPYGIGLGLAVALPLLVLTLPVLHAVCAVAGTKPLRHGRQGYTVCRQQQEHTDDGIGLPFFLIGLAIYIKYVVVPYVNLIRASS